MFRGTYDKPRTVESTPKAFFYPDSGFPANFGFETLIPKPRFGVQELQRRNTGNPKSEALILKSQEFFEGFFFFFFWGGGGGGVGGFEFRVLGFGFRVLGVCGVLSLGFWVLGFGFGFRVLGVWGVLGCGFLHPKPHTRFPNPELVDSP